MRDCPKCGVPMGPTDRRCFVCGTEVQPDAVARPVSGRDAVLGHARDLYGPELRLHSVGLRNLDAVAIWRVENSWSDPHHLLVSLGLSFQGVSDVRTELSGRGFELTWRPEEELTDALIQEFDRRAGEVDPVLPLRGTALRQLAILGLWQDMVFDTLETANGRVYFLEIQPLPDTLCS